MTVPVVVGKSAACGPAARLNTSLGGDIGEHALDDTATHYAAA